jgi:hypothetical protein
LWRTPIPFQRRPFNEIAKAFDVIFEFADEKITNKQILEKITSMIAGSRFSLFDITGWNTNVALELGIAIGMNKDYYLLFNPTHESNPYGDVPADLGGLDRILGGEGRRAELREPGDRVVRARALTR